jgi:hypothetical protein
LVKTGLPWETAAQRMWRERGGEVGEGLDGSECAGGRTLRVLQREGDNPSEALDVTMFGALSNPRANPRKRGSSLYLRTNTHVLLVDLADELNRIR